MNKTYRSVWNESTGTWVAAAETAVARGKKSRSAKLLVASSLAALGGVAHASGIDGGSVVSPTQIAIGTGAKVTASTNDAQTGVAIGQAALSSGGYP
ncbi:ESPR domain-containing protein [Paraburkholderia acidisoli]|uniref:ESPR domain-containing protein n=1 Tax=Paraburkholderia acidisoli TaxID=2571748 RepID=UPI0018EF1A1D|nr:ESPR domain-containing protein [Paraburkholderia acidisoli]